ncbi:hypothetical protein [Stenotrophomonas sp. AS1]|uniref:hypothetical protein n=1 Tax=Stenotrophomonas sp. AS1 TaxID=3029188 RepID=UPI003B7C07BF
MGAFSDHERRGLFLLPHSGSWAGTLIPPPTMATPQPATKQPHRQFNRPTLPLGSVSVRADIQQVSERTLARVKEVRRARGCGTAVFADPDGRVYALRSESVSADTMASKHPEWFVCEYAGRLSSGASAACPSREDIAEDLVFHFESMGRVLRDVPEQLDLWGFHGAFAEALCQLAKVHRSRRQYMVASGLR